MFNDKNHQQQLQDISSFALKKVFYVCHRNHNYSPVYKLRYVRRKDFAEVNAVVTPYSRDQQKKSIAIAFRECYIFSNSFKKSRTNKNILRNCTNN